MEGRIERPVSNATAEIPARLRNVFENVERAMFHFCVSEGLAWRAQAVWHNRMCDRKIDASMPSFFLFAA